MASQKSSSGVVSKRYANAFIDMAEESNLLKNIESDVSALSDMLEKSKDFVDFIANPVFSMEDQKKAVFAICKKYKFSEITANFLSTIIGNRRLYLLPKIIKSFGDEMSLRRGEVKVAVKVANDLSAKQIKDLEASLSEAVGSKVIAEVETDESLLGGMVVTVGSVMIDDSVRHKLDRLANKMKISNENEMEEVA